MYEIAVGHETVTEESVHTTFKGVTDRELQNKIRNSIKKNSELVKKFLLSDGEELKLEFQKKQVTRKRSGMI